MFTILELRQKVSVNYPVDNLGEAKIVSKQMINPGGDAIDRLHGAGQLEKSIELYKISGFLCSTLQ